MRQWKWMRNAAASSPNAGQTHIADMAISEMYPFLLDMTCFQISIQQSLTLYS